MTTTYGSIDESDSEFRRNNLANLFDDDEFDYLPLPEIEEDDDKIRKGKADKIAFKSIFGETLPFDSLNRISFIPNQPILVKIINVETDNTHLLNPHLYCIEITHGNHTWKLYKRYRDIQSLHNELLIFKTKNIILPVITKEAKERRRSFVATKQNLSKFPNTPESLVRTTNNIEKRKALLEAYLQSVLKCPSYRSHPQTLQFLDVSNLSFVVDLGPKLKEGIVKKKCGGRRFALPCCRGVCQPGRWMKRWLVLKDSFVLYVRPEDGRISDVLLMDQDFSVNFGLINTGWRNGLKITNLSRHLYLKCPTQRKATEWYEDIMTTVKESGQDFVKPNRYRSYVPPRPNSYCNWFVDGASYMTAVADALESAKEEIFITDWMLSPELYLKRPMEEGDKWRLDEILKRKADGGVKVFVLVYKELQMALGINSNYTKRALLSKNNENIRVMRHPDGIKLWSHHEKCVVVDQKIAFLGGIDLCYGRWDTRKHRLTDFGSIHLNNIYSNEDGDAMKGRDLEEKTKKESTSDPLATQTSIQLDFDAQSTANDVEKKKRKILIKNGSEGSTDETTPSNKSSLDHVSNTLDAYLQKTEGPSKSGFATAGHAMLPEHSEMGGDNVIPKKEDEEELEEAFKAYIDKSGEGSKRRQIHDAMSHDWKSSLPTRLKKAFFERKKRKESEGDDDSGDEDCDKAEKYAWIGDKMRFGSGDPSMSQDNDSGNVKIIKPDVVPKSSRKLKLRSLADFKIMFHRHHSQTVDVTNDSAHRPWDENVFTTKECDETDKKLDDKLPPEGTEGSLKIWVGKDYVNFIFKDFVELDKPFTDMIDRRATPRMPWHDVGAVVFGKAARDVARHFIQRWNYTKLQKAKANCRMPLLLPRSNSLVTIPKWFSSNAFCCNCQILRSASEWSAGITVTENSIHNAYTDLILSAKHYIYIENQFFISIASDRTVVNQISAAIYERIVAAHRAQKNFRVYVLLPLLPAFEGQLGTNTGTSIQAVIHWNYASISRGNGNSLLERLVKAVPDPFKYISFYGLRKHENMLGKLTTELVYVHAKLMIVDDQSVIIGSANINDRSMLGSRDSELALVVQDTRFVDSKMDGQPYKAGAFACSLRKSLFREHLGLFGDDAIDVSDPVAEEFYKNVWLKQASVNTSIYSKVFNCIPTDEVLTLDELRSFQKLATVAESDPELGKKMLTKVKGQLVLMPLLFLSKEYLAPLAGTREALAPTVVWT